MSDQGERADLGDRLPTLTPTQEERRGSVSPPPTLFPLGQFLPLLLEQEGVLWQRNEGILHSLRTGETVIVTSNVAVLLISGRGIPSAGFTMLYPPQR